MFIKRSVVISSLSGNEKGILTIEKTSGVNAYFKFNNELKDAFAVFRFSNGLLEFYPIENNTCKLAEFTNLNNSIACAVLQSVNLKVLPTFIGATDNKEGFHSLILSSFNELSDKVVDAMASRHSKIFETSDEEVEDVIDDTICNEVLCDALLNENKCQDCIYRKAFFEAKENVVSQSENRQEEFEEKNKEIIEEVEKIEEKIEEELPAFYKEVKKSLDDLFMSYDCDEVLEGLIPDSKWVKVDYEGSGDYYSVGLIMEMGKVKYISYAIPSVEGSNPPIELEVFSQWINVNENSGYWLTYQDAKTGENVKF